MSFPILVFLFLPIPLFLHVQIHATFAPLPQPSPQINIVTQFTKFDAGPRNWELYVEPVNPSLR